MPRAVHSVGRASKQSGNSEVDPVKFVRQYYNNKRDRPRNRVLEPCRSPAPLRGKRSCAGQDVAPSSRRHGSHPAVQCCGHIACGRRRMYACHCVPCRRQAGRKHRFLPHARRQLRCMFRESDEPAVQAATAKVATRSERRQSLFVVEPGTDLNLSPHADLSPHPDLRVGTTAATAGAAASSSSSC